MRRHFGIATGLAALTVTLAFAPLQGRGRAAERRPGNLRVGVINTLCPGTPEPVMQALLRPFKSLLEEQAGVTGHLVIGGDAYSLGKKLKDDQVQLAVFHGLEFAWARAKDPDLKPLFICVNHQRVQRAYLVVLKDAGVDSVQDLKGKTMALPQQTRAHCRVFLERRCVPSGAAPQKFFGSVSAPADLEEALDDVVDGRAKATVVDGVALAAYRKIKPGCAARLKNLLVSEAFPPAVIAYRAGSIDEQWLRRFRDGMIAAKSTRRGQQLLEMCRITAFEAVPDDYEQMLGNIVRAYPPPADK